LEEFDGVKKNIGPVNGVARSPKVYKLVMAILGISRANPRNDGFKARLPLLGLATGGVSLSAKKEEGIMAARVRDMVASYASLI
jgi:hypothetical protein